MADETKKAKADRFGAEHYPGQGGGFKDGEPRELAEMPQDVRDYHERMGTTIADTYIAFTGKHPSDTSGPTTSELLKKR